MPRWHREIFRSPDPDVRRAAAGYILAGRKPASGTPEAGCVIEFVKGGHLRCGVVWPSTARGRSLLVVDAGGVEARIRRDKVVHQSTHRISMGRRTEALRALRRIDSRRDDLRDAIDMATLWEVALETNGGVGGDTAPPWSLKRLADLCYGSDETEDGRAHC